MLNQSDVNVVNCDFGEVVGYVDFGFLVLFKEALYFIDNIGDHTHDLIKSVASAYGDKAHVALINGEERDRLNGDSGAAAAAEKVFFLVFGLRRPFP